VQQYTPPPEPAPRVEAYRAPEKPYVAPRVKEPEVAQERPYREHAIPAPQPAPRREQRERAVEQAWDHEGGVQPWDRPKDPNVPNCERPRAQSATCAHVVEVGETLTAIARSYYGTCGNGTMRRIVAANPGLEPDRIYIGQTLYMPRSRGAEGASSCAPCGTSRRVVSYDETPI
jgi:nucleoid-associated protein YgaU